MFFVTMEPNVMTPKRTEYGKAIRKQYETHQVYEQRKNISKLEPRTDGICNTLTGVQKDNLLTEPKTEVIGMLNEGVWANRHDYAKRVYSVDGVAPTQSCCEGGGLETKIGTQNFRIRKLTERECFRLMDVSESDIDKIQAAKISRTQQYKMAGNSIVVACLENIFNKMFVDTTITELTLF